MFCYITENWRSRPLVGCEAVVNLIGYTTDPDWSGEQIRVG
jgi:hypothetical protein